MTSINVLNVVTEDDVAGAVAEFGTKHTNSSSASVEISKIKEGSIILSKHVTSHCSQMIPPLTLSTPVFRRMQSRQFFIELDRSTGITIDCHDTRSLQQNRKQARKRLLAKLDNMVNGENSKASIKGFVKASKKKKNADRASRRRREEEQRDESLGN